MPDIARGTSPRPMGNAIAATRPMPSATGRWIKGRQLNVHSAQAAAAFISRGAHSASPVTSSNGLSRTSQIGADDADW